MKIQSLRGMHDLLPDQSTTWQEDHAYRARIEFSCIVNGPGEAKLSDYGLTGGSPANLVYLDGMPDHKISQERLVDQLEAGIRAKAAAKEAQMAIDAEQIIARG